jgi:hypothetical protein
MRYGKMKRITDHIRARLTSRIVTDPVGDKAEAKERLLASEWSSEFERLMRNRLLMGRYRYGRIDRTDNRNYARIASAVRRLSNYETTGNLEYLVDAANLCLMEFEHSEHPEKHFDAADDGEHVTSI